MVAVVPGVKKKNDNVASYPAKNGANAMVGEI
jgi:hypothetical protein